MRAAPSRIAAGALDLLKLQDRRQLEKDRGLPRMDPKDVLRSSRKDLGLEPLPPVLEKWVAPPPRRGGKPR
jgi:hypothetical protein